MMFLPMTYRSYMLSWLLAVCVHTVYGSDSRVTDAIVVGAGPAGLSAALTLQRFGLETILITGDHIGGQLAESAGVENWPGIISASGSELMDAFFSQVQIAGVECVFDRMSLLKPASAVGGNHTVMLESGEEFQAPVVILALGSQPRKLGIRGEDAYWARGVSSCAICDGYQYKGKDVVVVGGGDSAAEEALALLPYARTITILVRSHTLRMQAALQRKLALHSDKINIRYGVRPYEIEGDDVGVTNIRVFTSAKNAYEDIACSGVFLAIGHIPNSGPVAHVLACEPDGTIALIPGTHQTSVAGIFAAGDVTEQRYRQARIAVGSGDQAALEACSFFNEKVLPAN